MTATLKTLFASISAIVLTLSFSSLAFAAAPDGAGPWADTVLSSSQGMMKNGGAVPAPRSDPNSALGVAEDNTTEGNFFSLGFGGNIALGFDNGISSGVIVVEATNPNYPIETAKVEVSQDGVTWVNAGNVAQDGTVNKPDSVTCAKYVRVTDTSNPLSFSDDTADGYDVDGVKATGEACTPPTPTPTPPCDDPECCKDGNVTVVQKNKLVVKTVVSSSANTGGNKINGTTGDSKTITTESATSNVTTTVTGGVNVANVKGCCQNGNTDVKISGNGKDSKNTVIITNGKVKSVKKNK